MKQFPLSAFMMTLEVSLFRFCRDLFCSFVMFLWFRCGTQWRMAAVEVIISSLDSVGKCLVAATTLATIALYGIVERVGLNLRPLSRRKRSASCRGFLLLIYLKIVAYQ